MTWTMPISTAPITSAMHKEIHLYKQNDIYYPELILTKATENGSYKQVTFQLQQGIKSKKHNLTYDIGINDFAQNDFKIILYNGKESYSLGREIVQNIDTGNYSANVGNAVQKLGADNMYQIPVVIYKAAYKTGGIDRLFVFRNSTDVPRSTDGDINM